MSRFLSRSLPSCARHPLCKTILQENSIHRNKFMQNNKAISAIPFPSVLIPLSPSSQLHIKHFRHSLSLPQKMTIMTGTNGIHEQRHFVLVPLLAQGHMIPMLDMARLIAGRGALVSFITTPVNAARTKYLIDHVKLSGLPIKFIELEFPCAKTGLPEGCENVDLVPSPNLYKAFFDAHSCLREPLEIYLNGVEHRPSCFVVDYCHWWMEPIARAFDIPRIIFHGPCCFYILCMHNICQHNVFDGRDEAELVDVPNLPLRIQVSSAQAPGWFPTEEWREIREKVFDAEATADGVVVNTFYELEPEFIELYGRAIGKKVWPIGPLSLCNKDDASKAARGDKASIDQQQLIRWLDSKETKSVMYVNFGSLTRNGPLQLIEIGCGLEASGRPFIWVMKESERSREVEEWMAEGFEERTKERGLIIRGWVPQVVILSHPAVGGFMTHCGWNSTFEAVTAGVPMVTWPRFADQFLNEKLVVEVLKVGISLGVKVPSYIQGNDVFVKREEVKRAVVRLLEGGGEAEERRNRVAELGERAKEAMQEGGSSYENLTSFIEYVSARVN